MTWTGNGVVNSPERLLRILDQFETPPGIFTAEQLHEQLGYSRSTLYRYLKMLSDAGLLASFHGEGFTLGPRIIELNAAFMARDPMIVSAIPVMQDLSRQFDGMVVLCRRYRDKVLCVYQVGGADGGASRDCVGQASPLTRGSASRVILAHFSAAQLRKLFLNHQEEFAEAGLGDTLADVRRSLRLIRDRGCDVDVVEAGADPDITSVAAPIVDGTGVAVGSLCLSMVQPDLPDGRIEAIADQVMDCAEVIGYSISGLR